MRQALRLVVMFGAATAAGAPLVSCGSAARTPQHVRMSARDIVDASLPAIVRIEAGDDKVGTGFLLDSSGLVATNLHVVAGESSIKVKVYKDPTDYQVVSIAGVDRAHDLALLWIKATKKLPVLHLGDATAAAPGDKIYAIGNPLGVFDYSVSDGLISQVRTVSADLTILQISAPISQGSSGGPLLNQFGEVIGVTTLIVSDAQNINLAVPVTYLAPLMKQPQTIALAEFAKATAEDRARAERAHGEGEASGGGGPDDPVTITRRVPNHPVAVWDGCNQSEIEEVVHAIGDAISSGAPLYNMKTPQGYEACFRVYEGTALKWEHDARCKGVQSAFGDGLLRAGSMNSYMEKAWAMRDAFDGLIDASQRWCAQDAKCRTGAKP
jgi:S1-C subfamily serine protease